MTPEYGSSSVADHKGIRFVSILVAQHEACWGVPHLNNCYQHCLHSTPMVQVQIQMLFIEQKAKNQKAKQTIKNCTTKQYNTRQEMKCNAMRWKK